MANFYEDNEDIQFHLRNTDLSQIIAYYEDNLTQRDEFDYAPSSIEDAIDS